MEAGGEGGGGEGKKDKKMYLMLLLLSARGWCGPSANLKKGIQAARHGKVVYVLAGGATAGAAAGDGVARINGHLEKISAITAASTHAARSLLGFKCT